MQKWVLKWIGFGGLLTGMLYGTTAQAHGTLPQLTMRLAGPETLEFRWSAAALKIDGLIVTPAYQLLKSHDFLEWVPVGPPFEGHYGRRLEDYVVVLPLGDLASFYQVVMDENAPVVAHDFSFEQRVRVRSKGPASVRRDIQQASLITPFYVGDVTFEMVVDDGLALARRRFTMAITESQSGGGNQ